MPQRPACSSRRSTTSLGRGTPCAPPAAPRSADAGPATPAGPAGGGSRTSATTCEPATTRSASWSRSSVGALTAIAEIGQVAGVDAVFIGPTDLAVSSHSDEGDSRLAGLVTVAERRCAEHGITLGTTASDDAPDLLGRRGYDFLVLGADTTMLRQGARAAVRRAGTAVPAAAHRPPCCTPSCRCW